jgi:hypothetical protein
MPIMYATICGEALSLFKMLKEKKMTTEKKLFLQAVGGLIGTKKSWLT